MSKRYVLLKSEGALSESEMGALAAVLEGKYGKVKVISVDGNPNAVIVKTTNLVSPLIRDPGNPLVIGGKRLTSVATSGAVGNLKRRARETD